MEDEQTIEEGIKSSRLPLVFLSLDGWGIAPESISNSFTNAETPFFDSLLSQFPCTRLKQVSQSRNFSRNNIFERYKILGTGIENFNISTKLSELLELNKTHIAEVLSSSQGNYHVVIPLEAFLDQNTNGFDFVNTIKSYISSKIILHIVANSFDLKKKTALGKVSELHEYYRKDRQVYIGTVHGRNYIFNHDLDWAKTLASYEAMTNTQASQRISLSNLDEVYVKQKSYDNTIVPFQLSHKVKNYHLANQDSIIFFNSNNQNFQQIIQYIEKSSINVQIITLKRYLNSENSQTILSQLEDVESLSKILSHHHISQLKIAPARTFTGLTYSFNNNNETPFLEEKWDVYTNNKQTSAQEAAKTLTNGITQKIIEAIENRSADVIFASIPTLHLLAEERNFEILKKSIKEIDRSLKKIIPKVLQQDGTIVLVSPFGNAEVTRIAHDEELVDNQATDSTVPFLMINKSLEGVCMQNQQLIGTDLSIVKPLGSLMDVVPTILSYLGIDVPEQLQGKNIL